MSRRNWIAIIIALLGLAAVLAPLAADAFTTRSGTNVNIAKTDTVQGTLYTAGRSITVDADVNGDLYCAGSNVTINGAVNGDIICVAQTITINGAVDGNVRVAGQSVTLNSSVTRNVSVAAQTFTLLPGAKVGQDLSVVGQSVSISGPVGRDLYGAMASLDLGSTIGGNVTTTVNDINLGSDAAIAGDLTYTSDQQAAIDKARVVGAITYHVTAPRHQSARFHIQPGAWIAGWLYFTGAMLIIALLLALVAPKPLRYLTSTMLDRPGASIGWGLLLLFIAPFVLLLALITVIGIPLALLAGAGWIMLLFLTSALGGVAIGRWLLGRLDWNKDSLIWAATLGVPVTLIILGIPFVGFFAWLVVAWWVLGGTALSLPTLRA